ncbi:MAG: dTDP-4-dehydrorhamnose reductase [Halothiobacillaceae bacterium]
MTLRVLVTGARGQLGWELQRTCPASIELHAFDRASLDLTRPEQVMDTVRAIRPHWIINAAAYTAVDKAESEPQLAYAVNCDGARHLAKSARAVGARMIQVSTDFVFDGKQGIPYVPSPFPRAGEAQLRAREKGVEPALLPPDPLGIYGASKLAGEIAVLDVLDDHALILRTAWVYSHHGHNFVKTMLRLMRERESLSVVSDQIGSPTWAYGLAQAIWRAVARNLRGIHHWTDAGVASWYDFACAILEEARALGLLERDTLIRPIRTEDYPTPARRPPFSVLDKTATWQALDISVPTHWRVQLRAMLKEYRTSA